MRPLRILTLAFLLFTLTAAAQTDRRIEEQKRVIAALEKRIATEEQEISKIQKGRTATEERVRRLARQIDSRNQLLDETEKQARLLRGEIARTDSVAGNLSAKLERDRAQYGEMVREAYRNYKHNNYLTYIFSSRDFTDVARKITALREVASLRERKLRDIEALTAEVRTEKETLDRRKRSLDSVTRSLSAQREKLQRDARNAKASIRSMSQKEKTALQRKIAQEQQLDVAIGELRKLTKGNTEGASFSAKTSGLRLPVTAGRVKRYKENMAEITGPKGAHVISIYDGKVVDVKRNRITSKYDVYVAHGEYITSYANMGTICVEKGQKVARNEQLGTIGSSVNIMTMETEYKLVFFTNISHEFRTPLTLIQGALEKIHRLKVPKEMAYSLKIMDKSTERMLRLINQLLEFRKMQNNKLALSLEETDVIAFLYEIYLSFKDAAESKNMEFRFIPSCQSYRMFIDKGNVDKVVYNILSNAFKYTPSKGKIEFVVNVDEAAGRLKMSVSDTGVGIPKEKRGELFKRFMQSNFSGDSVGVGLHLTHELVNVHKGTITYEENPGGGSIFIVTLPTDKSVYEEKDFLVPNNVLLREEEMAEKHLADVVLKDEEGLDEVLPVNPLNKYKVLIVEDDNDVREFLKEELGVYFEVVAEADGDAGLERARNYDADLIISDVVMPGCSGFELTRKLKTDFNTSHIPVILLTAMTSVDNHVKGVECGADAYITKPFSPRLLLTRAFKLIEQREKLKEKFSHDPNQVRPALCSSDKDKFFVEKMGRIMETQLGNPQFTVDEFASMMGVGRSIFYRKVRGVTGYSPNEYIRIMRMKKAAELLSSPENLTVAEVSYQVGINDPFYFSKCFKLQFGVTPSVYQKGGRGEKEKEANADSEVKEE